MVSLMPALRQPVTIESPSARLTAIGFSAQIALTPASNSVIAVTTPARYLADVQTETMSGRTVYAGETRSEDLNELRGSFARDESRRGSFRMMRTGAAKSVGTKRSQKDRIRDALRGEGVPGVDGD